MSKKQLRAIDLYSGVGGWALGLRLAGINVVASYERWGMANETNFKNNLHQAQTVDIRRLSLVDLPPNIDIVVGSPPCTQFSFSNRGGNGNIDDGLEDIIKFLTIVDYLKPKLWVMENVPRVAKILEVETLPGGRLEKFKHLGIIPHVVSMEDYGLPQRRQRCIAGNFNFDLLASYQGLEPKRTLGKVVKALASNPIVDPIYGISLDKSLVRDHVEELPLNEEEVRINMAGKLMHPVYNSMAFPDRMDRSVRTITATCTRVSRESVVIEDPKKKKAYRRLTVRERASLQGFPITFQFYGDSYGHKLRMTGNAVPPLFSYYVGHTLLGTKTDKVEPLSKFSNTLAAPIPPAEDAVPDRPGSKYSSSRTFRFAIPSLRLKSGVRFEFANSTVDTQTTWGISFYFGTSKSIQSLPLTHDVLVNIKDALPSDVFSLLAAEITELSKFVRNADVKNMQRVWSHNGPGLTSPFMFLDRLDSSGAKLLRILQAHEVLAQTLVGKTVWAAYGTKSDELRGLKKLARNAPLILSGLIIGSLVNTELAKHTKSSPMGKLAAG